MMCALISSRPSSNTWNRPTGPAPTITASVSIGATAVLIACMACGDTRSTDQLGQLVLAILPFVGIGQRGLALGDARPLLRQLGVELHKVQLMRRHILLRHDRVDRALRDADRAVDALV